MYDSAKLGTTLGADPPRRYYIVNAGSWGDMLSHEIDHVVEGLHAIQR